MGEEAELRVSAGLETCLPAVYRLQSLLLLRIHLAIQYCTQIRTLLLERLIFISATICDNLGRLQNPGIFSACGVRSHFSPFARQTAQLLFFLVCSSIRSERTHAETLQARSARKEIVCLITHFSARENTFGGARLAKWADR